MNSNQGNRLFITRVCLVAALGGLLFGYDTGVINGSLRFLEIRYDLSATMKGLAASSALIACIFGAIFAGPASDRFGRKFVLLASAVLFLVSAIGTALPRNLLEFIIYRFIGGLGVGAASMTSPMYIAEITPARIRGRMISINQFAIVAGMLMVYFVNFFIARCGDQAWNVQYGWRWMFGSETIPALLFLFLIFSIPETPRWLTQRGRLEEALDILNRVEGPDYARRELDDIRNNLAHEDNSLAQLFQPGLRPVLLIGIVLAILQQVTGINVFLYFGSDIFEKLGGNSIDAALLQQVMVGSVNLLFTIIAIQLVDRLGRKPLLLIGATGMGVSLFAMGIAGMTQMTGVWLLVFVLTYIAAFALSVGPVTWVILAEIFPTRIRGRAMAIATFSLWLANSIVSQTFPMMDENPWLIKHFNHAFPFFIYGSMCIILILFTLKYIPETKGKSLEEIERFWLKY